MSGNDGTLGPKEMDILKTLLKFTIAMLSVPLISYFFVKTYILEAILGYEDGAVTSVVLSVVIIHIIIGLYIWTAIKEEQRDKKEEQRDKKEGGLKAE